jgi:hypothetical protein
MLMLMLMLMLMIMMTMMTTTMMISLFGQLGLRAPSTGVRVVFTSPAYIFT